MYPFFSVVIPTYNRADLILETLNTVFTQTYPHFEIIVVDNCSTDNTEELLLPLHDKGKIIYIRHERNFERGKSRNTGMSNAKGDFLTFLDSDDFMSDNCLQDAADYIVAHPAKKVFQNKYDLVNDRREQIYAFPFPPLDNQYLALCSGNFISCIGGFIHREIYTKVRFNEDPKMVGSEDYEVWFDVLAGYTMGRIDRVNCSIREHPNRSVHNGVYENLAYQKAYLLKKISKDPILFDKFGKYSNRLNASFLLQQAIVLKQLKQDFKALNMLILAVWTDFSIISTRRFFGVTYNIIKK